MRLLVPILLLSYVTMISLQATSLSHTATSNLWLKKKTSRLYDMQKRITPIMYGGILIAGFSLSTVLLAYSAKKTIEKKWQGKKQSPIKKYAFKSGK